MPKKFGVWTMTAPVSQGTIATPAAYSPQRRRDAEISAEKQKTSAEGLLAALKADWLAMCSLRLTLRLCVSAGKPTSAYGAALKTSVLFTSTLPNCMG